MNSEKLERARTALQEKFPYYTNDIRNLKLVEMQESSEIKVDTDGTSIFLSSEVVNSASDETLLFMLGHEFLHIKFGHMYRLKDEDGNLRDEELWNIATDAIINANLERDGFKVDDNYVKIDNAINYNAEELYEILKKKKAEQEEEEEQTPPEEDGGGGAGSNAPGDGEKTNDRENAKEKENGSTEKRESQKFVDSDNGEKGSSQNENDKKIKREELDKNGKDESDKLSDELDENGKPKEDAKPSKDGKHNKDWDNAVLEKALRKAENGNIKLGKVEVNKAENGKSKNGYGELLGSHTMWKSAETKKQQSLIQKRDFAQGEREELDKNRREIQSNAMQFIDSMTNQGKRSPAQQNSFSARRYGNVGTSKGVVDWKLVLRHEFENNELIWSQRRSIAENNYAYRLEEYEMDDGGASTEVMIDVSGSVSTELVKEFLRQLKPLAKETKLKVGFFAEFATPNFIEIKNDNDIDNLVVGGVGYGTEINSALSKFSKDERVNRIVFTDGHFTDIKDINYRPNLIWIVYDYKNFHAKFGKVMNVSSSDFIKPKEAEKEM